MSTFEGKVRDEVLAFISIDYFEEPVFSCSTFLLSHVHSDHTKGLHDYKFQSVLQRDADKYIYCSPITAQILRSELSNKAAICKVRPVEVGNSFTVYPPASQTMKFVTPVTVTLLPAAHCPGSVLFLLEYHNKRIMYTGDFRFSASDIKRMPSMFNRNGTVRKVNDLYLDTTFAYEGFTTIPQREDSVATIINIIKQWRMADSSCFIMIDLPYKYGMEFLYIELSKAFHVPVSVDPKIYRDCYSHINDFQIHTTNSMKDTFIHACLQKKCWGCPYNYTSWRYLKPSAMRFENRNNMVDFEENGRIARVYYSSHCSLTELREFVKLLEPDNIYSITKSSDADEKEVLSAICCGLNFDDSFFIRNRITSSNVFSEPIDEETTNLSTLINLKKSSNVALLTKDQYEKVKERDDALFRANIGSL